MDDLILVYDKNNKDAGIFASDMFNHSRKWMGLAVQEPKPSERTNFTVAGQNIGVIVTPKVFQSEFVVEALDLAFGQKKPVILIHDLASNCVVGDEIAIAEKDDHKKALAACKQVIYTFDAADQCQDTLCEIMQYYFRSVR